MKPALRTNTSTVREAGHTPKYEVVKSKPVLPCTTPADIASHACAPHVVLWLRNVRRWQAPARPALPHTFAPCVSSHCLSYAHRICKQLQGKIKPGAFFISLTKGMRVKSDGPQLISAMIQRYLGVDCSVLMGANIAKDIAAEQLSEAVIGYNNLPNAKIWKRLFERSYFMVEMVPDVVGAEMCGTLKNIVALAAGMVDGLGAGERACVRVCVCVCHTEWCVCVSVSVCVCVCVSGTLRFAHGLLHYRA